MTTRFYIEKRKDSTGRLIVKDRPVFLKISLKGWRVKLGTGIKTDLEAWDDASQRIKKEIPGSHQSNAWLNSLVTTAESAVQAFGPEEQFMDPDQFRELFNRIKPRPSGGFFDVFLDFMELNSEQWSNATFRKIGTLYSRLKEFELRSGKVLTFQGMDMEFLEAFTTYYQQKRYSVFTLRKALNNLIWFLNWASENGYNIFREYRNFTGPGDQQVSQIQEVFHSKLASPK